MDGELIILSSTVLGFVSSLLTELIKFIPWFNQTKTRKRALALAVSVIATGAFALTNGSLNGLDVFPALMLVIMSSFATYQAVIKTFYTEE